MEVKKLQEVYSTLVVIGDAYPCNKAQRAVIDECLKITGEVFNKLAEKEKINESVIEQK